MGYLGLTGEIFRVQRKNKSLRRRGLILTKLGPLLITERFVSRERLIAQIKAAGDQAQVVSLVCAAGSGKSVLLAQVHHELRRDWQTCWISFDADDNNVQSFLSYLCAALADIDSRLGKRAFGMLNADVERNIEYVFQTLCEDISEVEQKIAIFLDDFQAISDQTILAGMSKFISSLPVNVAIFIASRSDTGLELGKRRVDGSYVEFNQEAINFSFDEASAMLASVHKVALDVQETEMLLKSTEGWATGIQLVGMTLKGGASNRKRCIESYSGSSKGISAYLIETVFSRQPQEVRHFLLMTSLLGRMTSSLCNAVLDISDSQAMLDYLQRENMFLIPLDDEGRWFRYHHLFAEFLRNQVEKRNEFNATGIAHRAGKWCAQNGLYTEAIRYLLEAAQYEQAAELIAREGTKVAQLLGDHKTVLDWMRMLPSQYHVIHPQILLNYAWSHVFTRSSTVATEIAERVRSLLDASADQSWKLDERETLEVLSLVDTILSISLNAQDEVEQSFVFAKAKVKEWTAAPILHKATLSNSLGLACVRKLDFEHGLESASAGRILSLQCGSPYLALWAGWISAFISIEKGVLNEASAFIRQGYQDADSLGGAESYGGALVGLLDAEVLYLQGEMDGAAETIAKFGWFTSVYGPLEPLYISHKLQAKILFARGHKVEAIALLHKGQELGLVAELPRLAAQLGAEEIKLLLRDQKFEKAIQVGERWGFRANSRGPTQENKEEINIDLSREMRARLLIAQSQHTKAISILNGLGQSSRANQQGVRLIEINILKSLALWRKGNEKASMRELAQATEYAACQNIFSPFLDAPDDMSDILARMVELRSVPGLSSIAKAVAFERRLLHALTGDNSEPKTKEVEENGGCAVGSLTPRELELLELLAAGLGNKELADVLLVSVPTVKWHLHNVFEKLAVRRRTAAVAKARELGIID